MEKPCKAQISFLFGILRKKYIVLQKEPYKNKTIEESKEIFDDYMKLRFVPSGYDEQTDDHIIIENTIALNQVCLSVIGKDCTPIENFLHSGPIKHEAQSTAILRKPLKLYTDECFTTTNAHGGKSTRAENKTLAFDQDLAKLFAKYIDPMSQISIGASGEVDLLLLLKTLKVDEKDKRRKRKWLHQLRTARAVSPLDVRWKGKTFSKWIFPHMKLDVKTLTDAVKRNWNAFKQFQELTEQYVTKQVTPKQVRAFVETMLTHPLQPQDRDVLQADLITFSDSSRSSSSRPSLSSSTSDVSGSDRTDDDTDTDVTVKGTSDDDERGGQAAVGALFALGGVHLYNAIKAMIESDTTQAATTAVGQKAKDAGAWIMYFADAATNYATMLYWSIQFWRYRSQYHDLANHPDNTATQPEFKEQLQLKKEETLRNIAEALLPLGINLTEYGPTLEDAYKTYSEAGENATYEEQFVRFSWASFQWIFWQAGSYTLTGMWSVFKWLLTSMVNVVGVELTVMILLALSGLLISFFLVILRFPISVAQYLWHLMSIVPNGVWAIIKKIPAALKIIKTIMPYSPSESEKETRKLPVPIVKQQHHQQSQHGDIVPYGSLPTVVEQRPSESLFEQQPLTSLSAIIQTILQYMQSRYPEQVQFDDNLVKRLTLVIANKYYGITLSQPLEPTPKESDLMRFILTFPPAHGFLTDLQAEYNQPKTLPPPGMYNPSIMTPMQQVLQGGKTTLKNRRGGMPQPGMSNPIPPIHHRWQYLSPYAKSLPMMYDETGKAVYQQQPTTMTNSAFPTRQNAWVQGPSVMMNPYQTNNASEIARRLNQYQRTGPNNQQIPAELIMFLMQNPGMINTLLADMEKHQRVSPMDRDVNIQRIQKELLRMFTGFEILPKPIIRPEPYLFQPHLPSTTTATARATVPQGAVPMYDVARQSRYADGQFSSSDTARDARAVNWNTKVTNMLKNSPAYRHTIDVNNSHPHVLSYAPTLAAEPRVVDVNAMRDRLVKASNAMRLVRNSLQPVQQTNLAASMIKTDIPILQDLKGQFGSDEDFEAFLNSQNIDPLMIGLATSQATRQGIANPAIALQPNWKDKFTYYLKRFIPGQSTNHEEQEDLYAAMQSMYWNTLTSQAPYADLQSLTTETPSDLVSKVKEHLLQDSEFVTLKNTFNKNQQTLAVRYDPDTFVTSPRGQAFYQKMKGYGMMPTDFLIQGMNVPPSEQSQDPQGGMATQRKRKKKGSENMVQSKKKKLVGAAAVDDASDLSMLPSVPDSSSDEQTTHHLRQAIAVYDGNAQELWTSTPLSLSGLSDEDVPVPAEVWRNNQLVSSVPDVRSLLPRQHNWTAQDPQVSHYAHVKNNGKLKQHLTSLIHKYRTATSKQQRNRAIYLQKKIDAIVDKYGGKDNVLKGPFLYKPKRNKRKWFYLKGGTIVAKNPTVAQTDNEIMTAVLMKELERSVRVLQTLISEEQTSHVKSFWHSALQAITTGNHMLTWEDDKVFFCDKSHNKHKPAISIIHIKDLIGKRKLLSESKIPPSMIRAFATYLYLIPNSRSFLTEAQLIEAGDMTTNLNL